LKWAGEKYAEAFGNQLVNERRNSFALRNAEGRRQRRVMEQFNGSESYKLNWAGEKDDETYKKKTSDTSRESLALSGHEHLRVKEVTEQMKAKE